jgi:predicted RNA binding protein YcfA (HicA-like mRNA interferase family)
MTRLPRISGKDTIRKLKGLGFEVFDQSGSHVYLHKWDAEERNWSQRVTVPVHGNRILKLGTLKNILRQAEISVEQFSR